MPLFDFHCTNCGTDFTDILVRRLPAGHALTCDKCGKIGSLEKRPPRSNFRMGPGYTAKNGYSIPDHVRNLNVKGE